MSKQSKIFDDITNSDKTAIITNWLNVCDNSARHKKKNMNLLICGEHGIGKTTFITKLIEKLNYQLNIVDVLDLINIKDIPDYVYNIVQNIDISMMFNNIAQQKHVILIDNLETINSRNDKKIIKDMITYNNKQMVCPIICITDNKHNTFISSIKALSETLYFDSPSNNAIKSLLYRITQSRNINFESDYIVSQITEFCQNDYSKLYAIISDLMDLADDCITSDIFVDYISIANKKSTDNGLYMNIAQLFGKYENIQTCIEKYDTQKTYIPLTFDHNFIEYILSFNDDKLDIDNLNIIKEISDNLIYGNMIDKYIYNEQMWDLESAHAYMSCVYPAYLLRKHKIQTKPINILKRKIIKFALETNKSTLKQINIKKQCLDDYGIVDYIMLEKITKLLIRNKQYDECIKLYDSNVDNIEPVLKLNKLTEDKYVLTKQDREMLKIETKVKKNI
jgi:hypothetical protein